VLENSTLVASTASLEQYLFQATLFRVRPAGFSQRLAHFSKYIKKWQVNWVEDSESVFTQHFDAAAIRFRAVNMTARPVIAVVLPAPDHSSMAVVYDARDGPDYELTHISQSGMQTVQLAPYSGWRPGPVARELIMLTTNITYKGDAATADGGADNDVFKQLTFLQQNLAEVALQQHVLMGIDTPPVTVDLAYSQNLVELPPTMPAGHFVMVNIMLMHLSQGPRAASPDANVLLPDVWTHLMWSIRRWAVYSLKCRQRWQTSCGQHQHSAPA
jgi:hypothetical protein